MYMGRQSASVAKVICFTCRESACACVAGLNRRRADLDETSFLRPRHSQVTRAIAWLGGACVAGGLLGAAMAMLLGG
jgi:hypothetical protein